MLMAAICLVLVAMVTAQQPQPCCLPETYSMVQTDLKEFGVSFTGFSELSKDNLHKKIAFKVWSTAGGTRVLVRRLVGDYKAKKQYIILPNGQCTVNPFDLPFNGNCIPKGATWLGNSYLGQMATGVLGYDWWLFPLGQANVTVAVDEHCIPIMEKIRGMLGSTPMDEIYFFNGFRAGIADPSIFDIPSSCQQ